MSKSSLSNIKNRRILIFGGTGSLGLALLRRWGGRAKLAVYSRDEAKHWTIKNSLKGNSDIEFFVGDIRDKQRISECLLHFKPHIVIIASALKQVETCESAPSESIKTNILGVENLISSVQEANRKHLNIECVMLVSTDKACSPTNVYGMSKAIAERSVISQISSSTATRYICVRYGNVLDSRGSIIPLFRYQAAYGEKLTLTTPQMTRFIMTLDESVDLIENAITKANSGETWIPKLKSMSILDLAEIFSEKYKKGIEIIGIRPGEKIHEELVSEIESLRAQQFRENFVIYPPLAGKIQGEAPWSFTSQTSLVTKRELSLFLEEKKIFEADLRAFVGRSIEEIRKD